MRIGRKILLPFLLTASCLLFVFGNVPSQESAEEAFEKALYYEDVQGDLQKAIGLYEQILKQFQENREIAAKAQLHIGLCYEKLGLREATSAYQTVIQNYGEQKEAVAKAQERLAKLTQPEGKPGEPEGIRIRQIWKRPYIDSLGSVSSDGQFLAYIHWGEEGQGDIAIHNLISEEIQVLTQDEGTGFAMNPMFSKNSKQIAYSWWMPHHAYELFLIDVDNPSPRLLYKHEGEHVYPVSWLSDEKIIFTRYDYQSKVNQICSFNISNGTIRELKTLKPRNWPQISSSPDENFIAYDFADETENGNSDINLIPMDGGNEISLVKHPSNDRVLGWVPGRKEFMFLSDRSGTWDLWAIRIDDGKSSRPAKRIYRNIGEVNPVGFKQNGDCFFGFNRRNFNAYIAPFSTETGEIKEKSGKSLLGSNYWIRWSPDGQYLAYTKEDRNANNPWQLTILDLNTGVERKVADDMQMAMSPCWSPDGNSILVTGVAKDESSTKGLKSGVYLVDVKTGQTTEIFNSSKYKDIINLPDDDAFPLSDLQWSLDGKSIFYLFFTDRLVKHDLETGEDKILYKHTHFGRGVLTRSPDGKNLLLATRSPEEKKSRLFTISVDGGKEKELCKTQEANGFDSALWSPDGKYIYFSERQEETSLWRLPADGGIPKKVWQSKNRAEFFDFRPDGQQLAFAIREREMEIRVIENLVQELEKIFGK